MFLVKNIHGHYIPSDDESFEQSKKIKVGGEVKATKARNVKFHRLAFALLQLGFNNQEKYPAFEIYRKVQTILAGYYTEVPTEKGTQYFADSLSFENMSAEKFDKWYEDTLTVISNQLETAPDIVRAELSQYE